MKSRLLILTVIALALPFLGKSQTAVFQEGERLTYSVNYKAGALVNTDVAEVVLKVEGDKVGGKPTYHLHGRARVRAFFRWFYDLDDVYQTWLDKNTLKPLKFSSRLKEGKYQYRSDMTYDWNKMQVKSTYRNLKRDHDKHKTMKLTNKSFDALGLFYNLRCDDINSFKVGQNRVLELVLDDTIRRINYKYLGKETRKIPGLGTFKTHKFSCQLATSSGQSFDDGSEFYLWISDDRNKIPLYIDSPIKVGSIRGRLTKFEGLKYPLDSKIK